MKAPQAFDNSHLLSWELAEQNTSTKKLDSLYSIADLDATY